MNDVVSNKGWSSLHLQRDSTPPFLSPSPTSWIMTMLYLFLYMATTVSHVLLFPVPRNPGTCLHASCKCTYIHEPNEKILQNFVIRIYIWQEMHSLQIVFYRDQLDHRNTIVGNLLNKRDTVGDRGRMKQQVDKPIGWANIYANEYSPHPHCLIPLP